MNEQKTINLINQYYNISLHLAVDQFSDYDAYDDRFIIEIKNRRIYFKNKLIELNKMCRNYELAQKENKTFLYAVTDKKGIWMFNISERIKEVIQLPLELYKCPITTDFKEHKNILKIVILLPESMAFNKIQYKDSY